jgi:hypothetical protein
VQGNSLKRGASNKAGLENSDVDQGIAAVLAGVAGLVGAGVGGLATAYGARIGAQKTIEATRLQVERQAEAEHLHWIRDHRRGAYGDILAATGSFLAAAINNLVRLQADRSLSDEERQLVRDLHSALAEATARADLWGPGSVVNHAYALRRAAGRVFVAQVGWSEATREGQMIEATSRSVEYEAAFEEFKEARTAFVEAAIQALHR